MPMTALLLIPLMIFAALATDVGAWYIRADQTQRAADSAALAGTVWLPDQASATQAALDVAARNGFRDPAWVAVNGGTANASVSVPGLTADGGLRVDITTQSPSFFGAVVLDSINIERRAVAAVTPPVRMGNPSNGLGTGNLDSSELGITPDGVWLSLNGWCQDHQQGDPFSVGFFGAVQAGGVHWDACGTPNMGPNPTLNPDGYTFIVDVPPGAGQVALEVFEPGLCTDANPADLLYSAEDNFWGGPRLNFRVFANDNTELNHDDNLASAPVVNTLYQLTDCTGGSGAGGRWYTVYTIPAGAANEGRWYIQANVRQNVLEYNLNSFALRARPIADTQLCTSVLNPTCPDIYALDWLSLYRPSFGGGAIAGQPAEFFLADISDEHAGSTVEITMFDPGEGMDNVQFLDPAGNEVDFDFRLANCSVGSMCSNPAVWPDTADAANDTCSSVPCLDVTASRFQDQWIVITSDLDPSYNCGGNCWWKVRYTPISGITVTDRTTWSVRVVGGPVHLVD
ncbi:MAG: Tad domain-containing protein [Acidimicrobiia bacterium]|nr:Tad domain-containing protein [Acidimicrobiia bacterium]